MSVAVECRQNYTSYCRGCRCDDCRAAERAYKVTLRAKEIPAELHGRVGTYMNRGCRCEVCRTAWAEYRRDLPSARRSQRANNEAAKWVRRNHPDVWAELLAGGAA